LKPGKEDVHDLVWNLTKIAERQKDAGLSDSLKWAYDKTPCSDCRYKVIKHLYAISELKGAILDECQFDANKDITTLAKKQSAELK
jgi:hypothetical protein